MRRQLDTQASTAAPYEPPVRRGWVAKFGSAFRGFQRGIRGESNFFVHLFCAAVAIAAGIVFRISAGEWALVVLCITAVLAAEMFNTSIEALAKAVTRDHNPWIADALDIAAGAVTLVALGAAVVGLLVFVPYLLPLFGW
ncbi:MAG TPA: diacylglycerol kinase family protein [Pirellulales bacterium]|nr:diacylglycerol kinase family protein [Pirellulales bacterium]